MTDAINIFWFRRDLRLHDNCGLYHALAAGAPVLCIFIFDTEILDGLEHKYDRRVDIIHRMVTDLSNKLNALGSSLLVMHDTPAGAFATLTTTYKIQAVYTNHDYEPYAINRDRIVDDLLRKSGIPLRTFKDQVIFEKQEVTKANGMPYLVFTPYSRAWKQKLADHPPVHFASEAHFHNFYKTLSFPIATLADIGFLETDVRIPPVEINEKVIMHYEKNRNIPHMEGTSNLSVHLRFGTISIRRLVRDAVRLNEQFLDELIWREFFMSILFHFPEVVSHSFKRQYDNIQWRKNEADFERWCYGQTGYPIVDAGMRQLNQTGRMHNRVRMIVASFLTKHLLIDWRWGEAYFAEKLLDYELASNNGNWQWAAGCGCDAAPYFRIFSPAEQTKKFDPEQEYIRKWVPDFDTASYPAPMVEDKPARARALKAYKDALQKQ